MVSNKIKNIIDNSGNDLHQEVIDFFRTNEWDVKSSPYYNDPSTNKPREIDIIATKSFGVRDGFLNDVSDSFTIRLFIECKYIKEENVLWFESKNIDEATELAKDNPILRDAQNEALQNTSVIPNLKHHYILPHDVVKRWDKNNHADPLYDAMNGCLNGQIFYKEHQYPENRNTIDFPLIVINGYGNLYRRDNSNPDGYSAISESFQIEVDYSFINSQKKPSTKYFLIDVISKNDLYKFTQYLDNVDVNILKGQLAWDLRRNAYENRMNEQQDDYDPFSAI